MCLQSIRSVDFLAAPLVAIVFAFAGPAGALPSRRKPLCPQFHLEQMSSLCFELGHPAHRQLALASAPDARTLLVSTDALRIERRAKPED